MLQWPGAQYYGKLDNRRRPGVRLAGRRNVCKRNEIKTTDDANIQS